ncbi:gamma-glutamyl-gamma-aminobutyrate hydrolase family protein [Conexibacter sp. SYSU D00693]|uniref:gamma-glutamyl-gamma-aminobutyrate hydrolase family protein n=1 Tax=Conexibacter sp. SYSU D00693 TaxID=2812560 RepID=UPI00196AFE0D|nr:gamma-glutamyl-gamma-aminobutyrate hydrolase family protein [Conexibacter sp. SYSU D00693]
MRPLIGVTTSELRETAEADQGAYFDPGKREMALGMTYMRAIERAGGLPVVLPPMALDAVGPLLDQLDGLCLSGGPDLHPAAYGAKPHPRLGETEPSLDRFEYALAREADTRGVPVLGVCRGAQAMNVARGGTLHQHLDGHRQAEPGVQPTHEVEVREGSLLARTLGATEARVNSFHHQAVAVLGKGLQVTAYAPDGVIEAFEAPGRKLYLGVQWHAETLVDDPAQLALFELLVARAAGRLMPAGTAPVMAPPRWRPAPRVPARRSTPASRRR